MNGRASGPPPRPAARGAGRVRIIGGRWRGTRLAVPERPGLRPTSDRVRETLFNWLQATLPGARVLDLFAGSGALGIEAASRGASEVVLVERDAVLAATLRDTAARLPGGGALRVEQGDALRWLGGAAPGSLDLAFLDPPFADGLLDAAARALHPALADGAGVYVERGLAQPFLAPDGWGLVREGRTREVRYALYRVVAEAAGAARLSGMTQSAEP